MEAKTGGRGGQPHGPPLHKGPIIEAGVTECDQIAAEMKVQKYTVSRLAKKAIDAGWLRKRGRNYELVNPGDEGEKNGKKKVKK